MDWIKEVSTISLVSLLRCEFAISFYECRCQHSAQHWHHTKEWWTAGQKSPKTTVRECLASTHKALDSIPALEGKKKSTQSTNSLLANKYSDRRADRESTRAQKENPLGMLVQAFNLRKVDPSDFKVSLVYIASSKSVTTCLKNTFQKPERKF